MDRKVGLVKANQELQALTGCQREVEVLSELGLSTSILNAANAIDSTLAYEQR